jgi:phosphoenolpyruvate carboxylase
MNKLLKRNLNKNDKKDLNDAMMASIAGISAAIKNTG